MSDCGCEPPALETAAQKHALRIALALNAVMFVVELASGLRAGSTGLIADGLDMLSDAAVYAIALVAIGASSRFKANAALGSGIALFALGLGLLAEVARRFFAGTAPEGPWMIAVASIALVVNVIVLRLLATHRRGEVHLRAAWIFTRADVVANAAVIASGLAVLATGIGYFDLIVGAAIGLYVLREAVEIVSEARQARRTV
ncbi:cation diffusion facilitator family transporter [Erythrobacter sp. LQ02-29]|uniref:cation diffusion facilitator family transporter n=1 Tax=Erythrobacter sp. LQ02-29 TaxID=2920384 RepID=UPI001F4D5447|nr:cation diffusion facilitator family transporter [Erythrobacter sp. LQ02-29]MCP9222763.1 cation diffusion facilitator family transporter [Erythrobacter sp. LQ02-29]